MRSEKDNSQCTCCNGPHIFCRYFDGMSDFDDITLKARFRNDLEGRTFRLVLELLPAGGPGKEGCDGFLYASGDPRGEPKLTLEQDEFGKWGGVYGARSVLDLSARRKLMR